MCILTILKGEPAARDIAQLLKCLPCKHENPPETSQNGVIVCKTSLEETDRFLGLPGQPGRGSWRLMDNTRVVLWTSRVDTFT